MGRPEDAAVAVDQIDEEGQRHPPHLQETHLHTLRHDHQDVSRVTGVILDPLENHKICVLLSFDMLLPVTVPVVCVMVRNNHSLKSLLFKQCNILFHPDLAVDGSFFYVAVHVYLHGKAPFL